MLKQFGRAMLAAGLGLTMTAACSQQFDEIVFFAPSRTVGIIEDLNDTLESKAIAKGIKYTFSSPEKPLRDVNTLPVQTLAVIWPESASEQERLSIEGAKRGNTLVFFGHPLNQRLNNELDNVWSITCPEGELALARNQQLLDYMTAHPDYDRNHNGILDFILVRGTEGSPEEKERSRLLFQFLKKKHIKYSVLDDYIADWEFGQSFEHFKEIIGTVLMPQDIDMVIANNDDMALGAIGAMMQSDQFHGQLPPVFGIDGIGESYMSIRDGVMQSVKMDVNETIDTVLKIYARQTPAELRRDHRLTMDQRRIYVPSVSITRQTLSKLQ